MDSASKRFSISDQLSFADLSGDYNPVHIDPVRARRTLLGQPVVHGLHIVLWALNSYCETMTASSWFANIRSRFPKPLFLGETVRMEVGQESGATILRCMSGEAVVAQIQLSDARSDTPGIWPGKVRLPTDDREPKSFFIEDIASKSGFVDLNYDAQALTAFFPAATQHFGAARLAHMLGITWLVGMECPGLHSLLAGFSIQFSGAEEASKFEYRVTWAKPQLSLVRIEMDSGTMKGTVEAFVRPPPQENLAYDFIATHVHGEEFGGRRALIVGGSRGLGRLTAMLLAAGGADVVISYQVGEAEARKVVEEVRDSGGSLRAIAVDVARPGDLRHKLKDDSWVPTDLYYFATPHIFVAKKYAFDNELFHKFLEIYTNGFASIVEASRYGQDDLCIFYPSTVALDETGHELLEYRAAKYAGEMLCHGLNHQGTNLRVLVERLPRLPTDQTSSLMQVPAADPVETMLAICRKMQFKVAKEQG